MTGQLTMTLERHAQDTEPASDLVLVSRARLLALAKQWWEEPGRRGDASFIRAGCIGQPEQVPMTRALAERWNLTEG